jgi:hypothetical protein
MPDLKHAVEQLDTLLELLVHAVLEEFRLELEDLAAVMGKGGDRDVPADDDEHHLNS